MADNLGRGLGGLGHDLANGGTGGVQSGPKGNQGGKGGKTNNGVPIQNGPRNPIPSIPDVKDTDGGAVPAEPVDLSLLAGPQDLPKRRPLTQVSTVIPGANQITGWAGVFVP